MTINRFNVNCEPAMVQTADDSEHNLINKARQLAHQNAWEIGELAAEWHQRYAKGRTDGDFAEMVGLSEDQVYQRRRVWELFGARRNEFTHCRWTHFRDAIAWDDALECLEWAESSEATAREMLAWRKAKRGEPLWDIPHKPTEKPEGRTIHRDTTPKRSESTKPVEDRTQEPEVVTAPKFSTPAPKSPARAEADPPDAAETVNEAIEKITSLIQFVAKNGSPVARLRMAQVVEPLLAGIKATK